MSNNNLKQNTLQTNTTDAELLINDAATSVIKSSNYDDSFFKRSINLFEVEKKDSKKIQLKDLTKQYIDNSDNDLVLINTKEKQDIELNSYHKKITIALSELLERQDSLTIRTTPTELAKLYSGKEKIGGREISDVKIILLDLKSKVWRGNLKVKLDNGTTKSNELYFSLINDINFITTKNKAETKVIKEEIVIQLHPVFNTNNNYYLVNKDFNKLVNEASASSKTPEYLHEFINDLLLYKKYNYKVKEGLIKKISVGTLLKNYATPDQVKKDKKKVLKRIEGFIQTAINMGHLSSFKIKNSSDKTKKDEKIYHLIYNLKDNN